MTSRIVNERTMSVASTETVEPEVANENPVTNNDAPPLPKPTRLCTESRDVSVCSRNTRDSLRRNVSMRSNTFTAPERHFLEQLTVDGSDEDVEKALQAVEDEDLFFEYSTPKHLKHNQYEIGLDINHSGSSGPDDATRDAEAASVATCERRGLDKVTRTSLTASDDSRSRSFNSSNKPPIPSTILGSQRRREVLEQRRSDESLNMATLWRAHETGLAITSLGSQKSLLRRESSISSIGSNMSGLSVLFGNRPHPGATQEDVFRVDGATKTNKGKLLRQIPPPRAFPPLSHRSRNRRSKSATRMSLMNMAKVQKPSGLSSKQRAKSYVKRRSVTFQSIDEELEFDKDLESTAITPVNAVGTIPKRSQIVRRAVSDSHIAIPQQFKEEVALEELQQLHTMERESSISSIPSLHHGTPIRQDSISSIPSLHHGNALRDSMSLMGQSISSIPSLHQANPLRDSMSMMGQSTSSIPSLHHANALRDSMSTIRRDSATTFASAGTFPSLNPANPLRQDSTMSFPSLHHGNPIRQESMSSVPSIHHGNPIRQDSVASSIPPDAMTQDQMVRQFGVTEEMATAWIQLSSSKNTVDSGDNRSSLISNVTLPSSIPNDVEIQDASIAPTMSDGTTATTAASTIVASDDVSLLTPASNRQAITGLVGSRPKPVFLRQASRNTYEGEGVEVSELDDRPLDGTLSETDSYYYPYQPPDNGIFRTASLFSQNYGSIRTAGSFDDISVYSTYGQQQQTSEVFRDIRRSLSDDNLSSFVGQNKEFLLQIPTSTVGTTADTFVDEMSDDGLSSGWEMESNGRFDAWNILQDEYANGYGGAGTLGFKILGTSVSDEAAQPHVLSPPLMESLQAFLPPTKSGENFFMKYSMIRDGASLQTLLKQARGIQYSILAIETIDGEVFGSFTGQAWRKSWNYFGTGESFLWRMRHSRLDQTNGILDQAQKESEIDVYPYTGENEFIQLCTHDRIAVGGGIPEEEDSAEKKTQTEPVSNPLIDHNHDWGLGLALRSDLLQGSSSSCLTFGSPSLCKSKPNGGRFEVVNVELWAMTPCATEEDAERLELGKLFLGSTKGNSKTNDSLTSTYTY